MAATYCVGAILEKGTRERKKKGKRERDLSCVRFRVPWKWTRFFFFFFRRADSRVVLYGDRLRAANGTETRSNANARWTVRIEIWSRGEWCYGSILYKWYVNVILFGRRIDHREFIIPRYLHTCRNISYIEILLPYRVIDKAFEFLNETISFVFLSLHIAVRYMFVYATCKLMKIFILLWWRNKKLWIEAHKKIRGRGIKLGRGHQDG